MATITPSASESASLSLTPGTAGGGTPPRPVDPRASSAHHARPAPPPPVTHSNQFRETAWALVAAIAVTSPILGIGGSIIYHDHKEAERARLAESHRRGSLDRLLAEPSSGMLSVAAAAHGRDVFMSTCAACHGADAEGVQGLGKSLAKSWFVASLNDEGLSAFIREGREVTDPDNTTRMPMPPMGGRTDLTAADLGDLVAYLRGVQDARRMPELPPMTSASFAAAPTEQEKEAALAAAGGDAELAEYIAHGSKLFASSCASCHGKDARGLPKNGKDLVSSEFCRSLSDDALLAFVKKGRDPGDPANTTGVGMPAKGGNPALSDDDLLDVIEYLRSLQKAGAPAS